MPEGFWALFSDRSQKRKTGFWRRKRSLKRVFENAFSENERPEIFKEKHREGDGGTSVV